MPKITDGRLALGLLAAFAFWLFVALPFLYGPPPRFAEPSSPPQPHSEQAGQQPAAKPDGGVTAPFFIRIPKTAKEEAEEAADRREKSSTDRWLMIFTGAVALFTLLLVGATVLLYRAGEKQLRLASTTAERQSGEMQESITINREIAEASKQSSDTARSALISTQRAFVFLRKFNAGFIFEDGVVHHISFKPEWENSGVTPARDVRTWTGFVFTEIAQTIDDIEIGEAARFPIAASVVGPKIASPGSRIEVQIGDAMTAWRKELRLFIWAYIEYHDIFEDSKLRHTQISAEVVFGENPSEVTPINFSDNTLDYVVSGNRYNTAV